MNIKLVLLGVPLMALTGCAGSGYVHETYYGDGYYGPPPYPGTVYVHRETYYEPRPRVVVVEEPRIVVVRPPAPDHGHVDPRRMEERHEHHREARQELTPRRVERVEPLRFEHDKPPRTQERNEWRHERDLPARRQ
ncbi:MAG: hypothetical protein AB1713_03250 [Pseudomonadota bacterium]|jgi:hypothetical protein